MTRKLITAAIISLGLIGNVASAEDDPTSLSYISYLERYASVQPADGQDSLEAAINMPLVTGDRVDLARDARMEIVLADGNTVWLNEYSTLSLDSVALSRDIRSDRTVLYLADGNMIIELPEGIPQKHRVRVDSSRHTVYLSAPGVFRIDVLPTGKLWLEVWEGLASAATPAGEVLLRGGSTAEIGDGPIKAVQASMTARDSFSRWVQSIRGPQPSATEAIHVDTRYARQASQLNSYGSWVYIDDIDSWGWQPVVSAGWSPYTSGRWYWTPTGWSWLSYEPWGWLPYHYGTWSYFDSCGWVWNWGATWSPAWVYWSSWPGYVGWCPIGAYSSWWVGFDWGWGGFYWSGGSYHGGHHGYGGAGYTGYRSGRGPYTGRPGGLNGVGVTRRGATSASRLVLNMEGRTSASALRGRGWSAVPTGDFSSRNLSRSVRPASDFLRAGRTDKVDAIISAKPLVTESPRRVRPAESLRTSFEQVGARSSRDLSRIVARDASLSREEAMNLVQPAPAREVVSVSPRRSAAAQIRASTETSARQSSGPARESHVRSTAPSSTERSSREALPNAYRSSISRTSSGRSSASVPQASDSQTSTGRRSSQGVVRSGSGASNRDSSARGSSSSVPSNSLRSRALPSGSSPSDRPSSSGAVSSSRSRSTISSSPRGSSSSITSPGRSRSPTVIPGSSYSSRSSSRSYGSSSSSTHRPSSSSSSYRSTSPGRSYSSRSTSPTATSRSYSTRSRSSSTPRSSSSYGSSSSRSRSSASTPRSSSSSRSSTSRSSSSSTRSSTSRSSSSSSRSSSSRSSSSSGRTRSR